MWSDNDIDNAFRRLDPAESEPTPFPLDAWLKLDAKLDEAVIARAVRRRLWQFFAAEVAAVLLVALGWHLWPAGSPAPARPASPTVAAAPAARTSRAATTAPAAATTTAARPAPAALATPVPAPAPVPGPSATPAARKPSALAATEDALAARQPVASDAHAGQMAAPNAVSAGRVARAALVTAARQPATDTAAATRRPERLARNARLGQELAARVGSSNQPAIAAVEKRLTRNPRAAYPDRPTAAARPALMVSSTHSASSAATARHQPLTPPGAGRPILRPAAGSAAAEGASPTGEAHEAAVAAAASHAPGEPDDAALTDHQTAAETGIRPVAARFAAARQGLAATSRLVPVVAVLTGPAAPAAAPLPTMLPPVVLLPSPLPAVLRQPRFYVGVVAAPDVSTVKFADVRAPRLNVGLTLEYRLGQRWRVATGVQRSTKEYYARREDYDWTNYPRAYTRDFSWVDGSCTIIDVPLNLRYDAVAAPHYRLFGTVGLSSFFMHHERYTYDYYDAASNAPAVWERSFVNVNQHLFSVLNLSAGYEYGLGPHWRLQAEPYVKVPLAGVGAGKVKLLSAGLYFGLKYGF